MLLKLRMMSNIDILEDKGQTMKDSGFALLIRDLKAGWGFLTYSKDEIKDVIDEGEPTPLAPVLAVSICNKGNIGKVLVELFKHSRRAHVIS